MRRLISLVLLLCVCVGVSSCDRAGEEHAVRLYFLDVGQGDCTLVRTPEGDVLIDAGTEQSEMRLCLRLREIGVRSLRLAIFTHADEDHIGGADGVLSSFPTEEVWLNPNGQASDSLARLEATIQRTGTVRKSADAGDLMRIGGVTAQVLLPFSAKDAQNGNEDSIVIRLLCGDVRILMTGDIGAEEEERMLSYYGRIQLDCDLYKVGHHGSNTSTSERFLQAADPAYAVISCGAANSYGHPFGEVLTRLEKNGTQVLRTDLLGEIVFEIGSDGLTCLSESALRMLRKGEEA